MGEMADDLIDRMWDDDNNADDCVPSYGRSYCRNSAYRPRKHKPKVKEYPAKTFDMGFFPTSIPKPRTIVDEEPKEQLPNPWDTTDEEAPF